MDLMQIAKDGILTSCLSIAVNLSLVKQAGGAYTISIALSRDRAKLTAMF
jgi:hypothetical protein